MKLAYIAGPYRADTIWKIRQNILAAERLAAMVASYGFFPYCPHKNTAWFDGLAPDALWLDGNLEMIKRCRFDVCCVLDGWINSHGTLEEIKEFEGMGVPVLYEGSTAFEVELQKLKFGRVK